MPNMINGKSNNYSSTIFLSGKYNGEKNCNFIPNKIKLLKVKILNDYLIPLYSKQWNILKENMYFIHNIQKKINEFYTNYKLDDLAVYIDLLKVMKIFMDNYHLLQFKEEPHNMQFDSLNENESINDNETIRIKYSKENEIMSMVFQTTMIKLLPEYEIYNIILGKPQKELKQIYDQRIIAQIKTMLTQDNITFYKIKEQILHCFKYPERN